MAWDWDKLQKQHNRNQDFVPPHWDDIVDKFKNFKFSGGWIIGIIVLIIYFSTSTIFTVGVDEVGVVQRFGKYNRISDSGLRFKFPAGIEEVTKVKIRYIFKEEFGDSPEISSNRARYGLDTRSSNVNLMLTGDLNVAVVPWIVQYRVGDPYNFLFKVHDPRRLLRDLSESTMRLVVGDRSINEVISKREEIADQSKLLLQEELDMAETGIQVVTVEMKKTNVPEPVQPSFNEVNQAIQEKEKLIYQAREDYNKAIPAAKGEAEKNIKKAEGYSLDRINRAKGDASRFMSQQKEYEKARDVTRRRLYLEAMKELLPKLGPKFIFDSNQNNILPFLNLNGNQNSLENILKSQENSVNEGKR